MSQVTLGDSPYRNSNLFSGYYLDERVSDLDGWDCNEEAAEAFDELEELWRKESSLLSSYNENELIDAWIGEVLDVLGFDSIAEAALPDGGGHVDRLLFESEEARLDAAERKLKNDVDGMFAMSSAILEAKTWDTDFGERFSELRSYRDASHQIKYYLERTPGDLKWGVLTDGKKWRLYGTKDYETQTYYEVDLPEILESGNLTAFKYFYAFFRPEAFVEQAGSSFLNDVWAESETAAQELGEDLQDNVFRALRVLGKGFVESNDLDIDPDDEAARDELKEQSLVLLYRLMFILYAESRGLIDPDDPEDSKEYQEYFSLNSTREEILDAVEGMKVESGDAFREEYSKFSSSIWTRLSELFTLIDKGEEELEIPPYNGGLFDEESHSFLAENEVKDPYIAEVIYWLSTTETEDGEHVPADYADLDTRHLGSIYEGLLEHEFRIADADGVAAVSEDAGQVWKSAADVSAADAVEIVDEGGLYVVNDEGERKATGAYYTPDYVVTYIVEETVDPLIEEIDKELRDQGLEPSNREYFAEFWQEVKDLTILDPAMGSGHFLTKATGYLTEQVMAVIREQEIQSYDEQYIRREISKECIYGVDLNGMAVELSKLSMWLETLSADQPLAFLDHHLKTGNSLVGSDISEVLSDGGDDSSGQLTLTQAFARVRQDTLEHVMELMSDLLAYDNETLEDVKSMENLYNEIRDDPLYQRLFELANVHTAEQFGVDIPDGAYEQMASAIEDADSWADIESTDWFQSAQATAEDEDFFHWELEYPEVFFGGDGEKITEAGFDAVVGNPPYVRMEQIKPLKPFLTSKYRVHASRVDLYAYFMERSLQLTQKRCGVIVSNKWMKSQYGENLRDLLSKHGVEKLLDFGDLEVFEGISTYPCILIVDSDPSNTGDMLVHQFDTLDFSSLREAALAGGRSVSNNFFSSEKWSIATAEQERVKRTLESRAIPLSEYLYEITQNENIEDSIGRGIVTGGNDAFVIDSDAKENLIAEDPESAQLIKPLLKGTDIERYRIEDNDRYLIYIKKGTDIDQYPAIKAHLSQYKDQIGSTATDEEWYELQQAQAEYEAFFESAKICYPDIAKECSFAMDESGQYLANTCYFIPSDSYAVLGVLNSGAINWYYQFTTSEYRGGYQRSFTHAIRNIPIPEGLMEATGGKDEENLASLARELTELHERRHSLNLDLLDYLGNYQEGTKLPDIGLYQPAADSDSVLSEASEDNDDHLRLRIGDMRIVRKGKGSVLVEATARYRPDEDEDFVETDWKPAFRLTDLTETEVTLVEAFVPVVADEAGGFAGYREKATKTNTLLDRIEAITLPNPDDVVEDLERYKNAVERAEELDEKIQHTDDLLDEIVYDLYGLSDDEIDIIEDSINED